jgi:hypothetical protein
MKTTNTKTFALSGGAYLTQKALENLKTHACEVNAEGFAVRVLCGRVKLENVCNDLNALPTDQTPTCAACARKLAKG